MGNIICIILLVVWAVCLVGMAYCSVQAVRSLKKLKRNDDVASYRLDLIHRCYPDADLVEKIVNKHTYEEMLQSSKPLEDIYWFTPEEIEEIDSNHISHLMRTYLAEKIKEQ
mgnify:FL=1